jgi:hypothetical protein
VYARRECDEVSVSTTNDDPGMMRCHCVQADEVSPVQSENGATLARRECQDRLINRRAVCESGFLESYNVVIELT